MAEKVGVPLDFKNADIKSQTLKKYYDILEIATNFYQFYLNNTSEGQEALKYLYKRGLNDKIIKRFRIGLAPRESDLLYQALHKEKIQPLDMIEAGLVRSGSNNYYDIFRNRLIFPLEDTSGNIAGFSGRIYHSNSNESKYLNSNENNVFKKNQILYNFSLARDEIRTKEQVFIFEGFMDVIAAHKSGIDNSVAIMGTSLTEQQIRTIKRLSSNIIICFDGDDAGRTATQKAIYLLLKEGINTKTILMPKGLDPDDYLGKYGENSLRVFLNDNQLSSIDYLYEIEKQNLDTNDILSIEEFKKNLFQHLYNFNSNVLNEIFLNKIAEDLQITIGSIRSDFKKYAPRSKTIDFQPVEIKAYEPHRHDKYENSEKALIKTMFYHREKYIEAKERLQVFTASNKKNRRIIYKMFDYYDNNDVMNEDDFQNNLTKEEALLLTEIINSPFISEYSEVNELIETIMKYKNYASNKELRNKTPTEENLERFKKNKKSITRIKYKE